MTDTSEEKMKKARIGPLKVHNATIDLFEYDSNWPILFQKEKAQLESILGGRALTIEHVGSTSVPGLIAKPIIDMLLVVQNSAEESSYVPDLEAAGYILRIREPDWFEHRLFKGPDTSINLHTFSKGSSEIDKMLLFRDYLRSHPDERDLYANTKRKLAKRTWKYIQHYADAKTEVVESIIQRARQVSK